MSTVAILAERLLSRFIPHASAAACGDECLTTSPSCSLSHEYVIYNSCTHQYLYGECCFL